MVGAPHPIASGLRSVTAAGGEGGRRLLSPQRVRKRRDRPATGQGMRPPRVGLGAGLGLHLEPTSLHPVSRQPTSGISFILHTHLNPAVSLSPSVPRVYDPLTKVTSVFL